MNKYKEIYGVDISKSELDIVSNSGDYFQLTNDVKGFKKIIKTISKDSLVVMEATGYYHVCLAQFLDSEGISVSVVNPLSVKRFIQMKLSKVKTDKSDARAICEYAQANEVPIYTSKDKNQSECLQLLRLLEIYTKQSTSLKNKVHGEKVLGKPSKVVFDSLNRALKSIIKETELLEKRLLALVKENQKQQLTLLKSIPGIGVKTAAMLIVMTDGFEKFENAKQLCSYVGITPTIRQSGSSVRGKSRISKMGNRDLRSLLFLCSFSACKFNKGCKALYERIVAKGKSKKLALIAVANKLLKQAFAIAKSGLTYDPNFVSVLA